MYTGYRKYGTELIRALHMKVFGLFRNNSYSAHKQVVTSSMEAVDTSGACVLISCTFAPGKSAAKLKLSCLLVKNSP